MIALIGIAAVIILIVVFMVIRRTAASKSPSPGRDRFKHSGPGVAKPEDKPRAASLD
jgi:hypothetical protein